MSIISLWRVLILKKIIIVVYCSNFKIQADSKRLRFGMSEWLVFVVSAKLTLLFLWNWAWLDWDISSQDRADIISSHSFDKMRIMAVCLCRVLWIIEFYAVCHKFYIWQQSLHTGSVVFFSIRIVCVHVPRHTCVHTVTQKRFKEITDVCLYKFLRNVVLWHWSQTD